MTLAFVKTIEEESQNVARPTVIFGTLLISAYVCVPFLVEAAHLSFVTGLIFMTLITYGSYSVLHDAVHGSISGAQTSCRWLNETLGYGAGWIMGVPLTAHRHVHLAHHRNTNINHHDPDLSYAKAESFWSGLLSFWKGATALQFSYYAKNRWDEKKGNQNFYFCLEVFAQIGLRLVIMWQVGWWLGLALFVISSFVAVTVLVYLFAYLVHRPHDVSGRYKDTSTILIRGWIGRLLTILWGYQNYHSIHHLYPRVPFYRYPAVFNKIKYEMVEAEAPIFNLTTKGLVRSEVL